MDYVYAIGLGSALIVAVDVVGALLAVRSNVKYVYWAPVAFLTYVGVGAYLGAFRPSLSPFWIGLAMGTVEITLGTALAHRLGAYGTDYDEMMRTAPYTFPVNALVMALGVVWGHWLVAP